MYYRQLTITIFLLYCIYTMSFIALWKGARTVSHFAVLRHSRPRMIPSNNLFIPSHTVMRFYSPTHLSAAASEGIDDCTTVVSVCTKKIRDLLKPVQLSVTSTNDDPNGSHVSVGCATSCILIIMNCLLLHCKSISTRAIDTSRVCVRRIHR